MKVWFVGLLLILTGLLACSEPAPSDADGDVDGDIEGDADSETLEDGDVDGDGASLCDDDEACSDGLYCTGAESCDPGDPEADELGCVTGPSPCQSDEICREDLLDCIPEGCEVLDADGDGHRSIDCGGDDCDDDDANRFPGNVEVCDGEGHDEDCNTETFGFLDADGDGSASSACCNGVICGGDCNDADSSINPRVGVELPLLCDGVDNNCNGSVDEECPCAEGETQQCGTEAQRNQIGLCRPGTQICAGGAFTVECIGGVAPQEEVCDAQDNDCDSTIDEGVLRTYVTDADGDGYGAVDGDTVEACSPPEGYAVADTDCDDSQRSVNPLAAEACNGVDDNCSGEIDEGVRTIFWLDADGDGFGGATTTESCSRPEGYVTNGIDCDDTNRTVNPPALEQCDTIDNNCDGDIDLGCTCTNGATQPCGASDGAGGILTEGSCQAGTQRCEGGTWATCVGSIGPTSEVCNGHDDDCDGETDEGVLNTYYGDGDGDGFGSVASPTTACGPPMGTVGNSSDCNDAVAAINPAATEMCDGIDNNCDASTDPGCACLDGESQACGASDGAGGVLSEGECVAGLQICIAGVWTGCAGAVLPRTEVCNELDDDCDGEVDEALTVDCWADPDDDGWSSTGAAQETFCPVAGRAAENGCPIFWTFRAPGTDDCADDDPNRSPGHVELCNNIDDNCNGIVDEDTAAECDVPNAHGACLNGACAIVGCEPGFGDCNGDRLDGCEADTYADSANCGGCGQSCGGGGCDDRLCELPDGIDYGSSHGCMTFPSGRAACWGWNLRGQLGDGTTVTRPYPVPVSGLTDAIDITAAGSHSCALHAGGTASCWGFNNHGNLGNGAIFQESLPVSVVGLTGATQIDAGNNHTCARLATGALRCWGDNAYGQIGDGGTPTDRRTPVAVTGISTATVVNAGGDHACARLTTSRVRCWGRNQYGQLGDASTTDRSTSVEVSGITNATAISAGSEHSCAIRGTGSVSCWGRGAFGRLGNGLGTDSSTPVTATGITNAVDISAGYGHTCAVRATGAVACWGYNAYGQLGDGTTTSRNVPTTVPGLTNAVAVRAGTYATCALRADGRVLCWGINSNGDLGDGTLNERHSPTLIPSLGAVFQISSLGDHSCARRGTGELFCWGRNDRGQLGDSTTTDRTSATLVSGSDDYVDVSAGSEQGDLGEAHTCAVRASGAVECWGENYWGQLGDGSTTDRFTPTPVVGLVDAVEVSAGTVTSCALRETGEVACWGFGNWGALGQGSSASSNIPVDVSDLDDALRVAVGDNFACALRSTGQVVCWGANDLGQGGHGGPNIVNVPTDVVGLDDAVDVIAGGDHACARRSDQTMVCWGSNGSGQLGDGTNITRMTPVPVVGLTQVVGAEGGRNHTCARRLTGELFCWGANGSGQVGDRTVADRPAPIAVGGLGFVSEVAAGGEHSCVQLSTREVGCWGGNDFGQLGDGTTVMAPSYTPVNGL